MKVLIVDDEKISVDGLLQSADWKAFGFDECLVAYDIEQAKRLLDTEDIQLVLTDIEMDHGTGLDLLRWIREKQLPVHTAVVSCHDDFRYAKEAISFGIEEYLVKPVSKQELHDLLLKMSERLERLEHQNRMARYAAQNREQFWRDIINGRISPNKDDIMEAASQRGLSFSYHPDLRVAFVSVEGWRANGCRDDGNPDPEVLRQAMAKLFADNRIEGFPLELSSGRFLYIAVGTGEARDVFFHAAEQCVSRLAQDDIADSIFYVGSSVPLEEIADEVKKLIEYSESTIAFTNRVYYASRITAKSISFPDARRWHQLLMEKNADPVLASIQFEIDQRTVDGKCSRSFVAALQHDLLQILYAILQENDIQAHRFIAENESLFLKHIRSREELITWYTESIRTVMMIVDRSQQTDNVCQQIMAYINANLSSPLTRNEIASHVYLSADYVTKVFKRETGQSLIDYVIQSRIAQAKILLRQTELPISEVCERTGFSSLSHFSATFKKYVGVRPRDYRRI